MRGVTALLILAGLLTAPALRPRARAVAAGGRDLPAPAAVGRSQQIAASLRAAGRRARRLRSREAHGLAAAPARSAGDPGGPVTQQQRIERVERRIEHLAASGMLELSRWYRRKLIQQTPGRVALAARQLRAILLSAGAGGSPAAIAAAGPWARWASDRLIALNRAGRLPDAHEAVILALKARVDLRQADGRLAEADAALRALEKLIPGDPWVRVKRGVLLLRAGRDKQAYERLEPYRNQYVAGVHVSTYVSRLDRDLARDEDPVFPQWLALTDKWGFFSARPLEGQFEFADRMIADALANPGVTRIGPDHAVGIWHALGEYFRRQRPASLSAWRAYQQGRALALLADGARAGAVRLHRRWPYAAVAQGRLLDWAQGELVRGHAGLAVRGFRDVLAYSNDRSLRGRAQVGLWLALAQVHRSAGGRAALEAAFAGVDPDAVYPWMGGRLRAGDIRSRLLASQAGGGPEKHRRPVQRLVTGLPVTRAGAAAQFRFMPEEVRAAMWYAHGQVLQYGRQAVLVAGSSFLARIDERTLRPKWVRTPHLVPNAPRRPARLCFPAAMRPAVADGRVFCRWGLDREGERHTSLAAFDLDDGRMLWSTALEPALEGMELISDPVAADGRVYTLALSRSTDGLGGSVHLICREAADGRILWIRRLGSRRNTGRGPDLTRYGGAITLHEGEVYCSTGTGLVARCDARDGMIEWTRSYRRLVGVNLPSLRRRSAAAPLIAGGRVLFAPRDSGGVFAADRRTGECLWDSPYVPSDAPVGVFGDLLLTRDAGNVAAVDVRSGEVRWLRHLDDRLRGKAAIVGDSAYVAGDRGLYRLSAATGVVLDRTAWSVGPVYDFIIRGGRVVGIGARSVTGRALDFEPGSARPRRTARGRRAGRAGLRLPLARSWRLIRTQAQVLLPPPRARVADRLYILSGSVLECMSLAAETRETALKWRRFVLPGFKIRWWSKTLLALYPDQVVAYDARTGAVRWRRRRDRLIRKHHVFGRYLVGADLRPGRCVVEAVDLADGRRLWRRSFADLARAGRIMLDAVGWDGENLHLILADVPPADSWDVTCRAGDGRILRMTPIPALARAGPRRLQDTRPGAGALVYVGADGKLYRHRFGDDGPPVAFTTAPPNLDPRRGAYGLGASVGKIEVFGKWACLRRAGERGPVGNYYYLRLDDPGYLYVRRRQQHWPAEVRGDRLYEISSRALTVFDLPAKRQLVRYEVPRVLADRRTKVRMHSFKPCDDLMLTLSEFRPTRWDQEGKHAATLPKVRIDAFDRASGRHLAGQTLDAPYLAGNPNYRPAGPATGAAWAADTLVVTGPYGAAAYAPSATGGAQPYQPVRMIYRASRPIKIDGLLDDWPADSTVPAASRPDADARLMLAHDGHNLLLAASYADDDVTPRRGTGDYGGGDYLEVGLMGGYAQYRITVSRGANGKLRLENAPFRRIDPLPLERVRAVVRHDIARGRLIYELSIPIRDFSRIGKMHLAVRLCDDRGGLGPAPVLRLGRGLTGRDTWPGLHESFHFAQRTYRQELACLDICKEAPGLAESLAFTRRYYQARAPDVERRARYYSDLIRSHARGPLAMRMLMMLDQSLRTNMEADPTAMVRRIARSAGVGPRVLRRYDAFTTPYLSQWVYLQRRAERVVGWMPKYLLTIELFDGRSWNHRKSWYRHPERADDPEAARPYDEWIELRVPLIEMNMHDRPIYGIAITPHMSNCAILDRTAVVRNGVEHVFIDDAFPPGKTRGRVEWVTSPVKSGSKAHRSGRSPEEDRVHRDKYYAIFDKPITAHLDELAPAGPEEGKFDRKRAVAALRKNIPELDGSMDGWRFFRALLRVEAGDDLRKKIALYRWYLKANPNSPRLLPAIVDLWKLYGDLAAAEKGGARPVDPLAEMEAVIVQCKIPPKLAYAFRSDHAYFGRMFLRDWLVIGPFGNGPGEPGLDIPSQSGAFDLQEEYEGLFGTVRWEPFKSTEGQVDLNKALAETNSGAGYALCWVHSDRRRQVVVEFGMNANTHVWNSGQSWLDGDELLSIPRGRLPRPGMVGKKITLTAGWHEILVKITKSRAGDRWSFWFELIDPDGRGMPKGLKFSTTPPYETPPAGSGR